MPRAVVATDNFNRASLDANWSNQNTALAGNVLVDSSIRATGQFSTQVTDQLPTARWVGAGSFTADQYATARLVNVAAVLGVAIRAGVTVRSSGTAGARSYYEAVVRQDTAPTTTELAKWVAGTRTVLHSASVPWANGDLLELEAEGTTLRVYRNGVALGGGFTATDTSLATGTPGVAVTQGAFVDDWEGGNVTSGSATYSLVCARMANNTGAGKKTSTTFTGTLVYGGHFNDLVGKTMHPVATTSVNADGDATINGLPQTGAALLLRRWADGALSAEFVTVA
jgi:hypothetical protein